MPEIGAFLYSRKTSRKTFTVEQNMANHIKLPFLARKGYHYYFRGNIQTATQMIEMQRRAKVPLNNCLWRY